MNVIDNKMHIDIYLSIGLYIPIHLVVNYLLVKKINREHFWKLRCSRDYSLNNPLCLPYLLLYKLNYQSIAKDIKIRIASPPMLKSETDYIHEKLLASLNTPPYKGQIILFRGVMGIYGPMEKYYFFHLCKSKNPDNGELIDIGNNYEMRLPIELDLINKYPISYFRNLTMRMECRLDLTLYLPQITANHRTDNQGCLSYFVDWRGQGHRIYYNELVDVVTKKCFYTIKDEDIYLYGVPVSV